MAITVYGLIQALRKASVHIARHLEMSRFLTKAQNLMSWVSKCGMWALDLLVTESITVPYNYRSSTYGENIYNLILEQRMEEKLGDYHCPNKIPISYWELTVTNRGGWKVC